MVRLDSEEELKKLKKEFSDLAKIKGRFKRQYALLQKAKEHKEKNENFKSKEYIRLFDCYYREEHKRNRFYKPSTWTFVTLVIISFLVALLIDTIYDTVKFGVSSYIYSIIIGIFIAFVLFLLSKAEWSGFSNKTTWNWLDLLFVPFLLAIAAFGLDYQLNRRHHTATQNQTEQERLIEYISEMKELLQADAKETIEEIRDNNYKIMRALTASMLYGINDLTRKKEILRFIYEADLIKSRNCKRDTSLKTKVFLHEVNLEKVILGGLDLRCIDLRNTNLKQTNFKNTDLRAANLVGATIDEKTDFLGANLIDTKIDENSFQKNQPHIYENWKIVNVLPLSSNEKDRDLTDKKLTNMNLNYAKLINFNLTKADLSNTTIKYADLTGANLTGSKLGKTEFQETYLKDITIDDDTLNGLPLEIKTTIKVLSSKYKHLIAKIDDFQGLYLKGADLSGIKELTNKMFNKANLENANLEKVKLDASHLNEVNLKGSNLKNSELLGVMLIGAELENAILEKANLSGSNLLAANLSLVNLSESILNNATMHGVLLKDANLVKAKLIGTELQGANFKNSNLSQANFTKANLQAAKLHEAKNVSQAIFNEAIYDENTTFPENFDPQAYNLKKVETPNL